ncbi:MAG: hypothetical protein CR997_07395 [Acidobacteria bacterium]|nr:MAG: hypothetical protein CR997_07395 [Acidobacteriota bacterium]
MTNSFPGYLITLSEKGTFVGGMMITDRYGIPKDFKYTDPVTPTKVQKIIYGSVLERYIRNHVIVGALIKEVNMSPSFYVVPHHQMESIKEAHQLTLVSIQRTQFTSLGAPGTINRSKENECLLQGYGSEHPIRVMFSSVPVDQQEPILKEIVVLTKTMDIVEPQERLEAALKSICLEKSPY